MLIRVNVTPQRRAEVTGLVNLFRGRVVDVATSSMLVELSGTEDKIEAFIEQARPYGIQNLARTGVIAMPRGLQNGKEAPQDD